MGLTVPAHPQVVRTREFLDALARGEPEHLAAFFADDVMWHVAGATPLSGDHLGRDGLVAYFARDREEGIGALRREPATIIANDRHVAVFARVRGERGGRRLDVELAEMLAVGADGLWAEYWALVDDQRSVDAFWS